jgi:hypothetical protein
MNKVFWFFLGVAVGGASVLVWLFVIPDPVGF